jgi:predicted unusual protein kinase regulating ubiquinone biosynthesis (AarF/ABC1/UbiB family)
MARREDGRIPTGRIRRAAKVGSLAGGTAARNYATRAANLARGEDARRAAAERRQMEVAEQIVEALGSMKGAAMKVGQVASFIDTGAFPPEFQEHLQKKLAELRDSAPQVAFEEMRKVIERDLDAPLEEVFDEFGEEAVAAASIGQVYRARLADGREVAVKAQYPGVAKAVRADLQNLGLIMRVAKRVAPGMDAKAMTAEIRERLTDELDYEHEAQNQRAFARAWRDHPFIVVPDVLTSLCGEHVLVTEWIDGTGFEEVRRMDDEVRDRFGEIVFRFFFGSLYRNGHFSGDPHPGNYLLLDDGRVAFLDFGMVKKLDRGQVDDEIEAIRCGMEGDAEGLHAAFAREGYLDPADPLLTPDAVLAHFRDVTDWYVEDRELRMDPAYVRQILIDFGDPRSKHWTLMRHMTVPPHVILARRMEALTVGVLGKLEATANWHRIAREWLFGDPPSTPLGEAEEPFHTRRRARAAK